MRDEMNLSEDLADLIAPIEQNELIVKVGKCLTTFVAVCVGGQQ
jgi:hypothetical protein